MAMNQVAQFNRSNKTENGTGPILFGTPFETENETENGTGPIS
jgi:hypothetical protein